MRLVLLVTCALSLVACGGSSSGDDGGDDTVDAATGDGPAPGEFLSACEMDLECDSELCLEGPGVCTQTCDERSDCPPSSSWRCDEGSPPGVYQCLCPGEFGAPGCDVDCNGVDEDPTGTWRQAVASTVQVVHTTAQTNQYAFDLDGNGSLDNSFGGGVVPVFTTVLTGSSQPSPILETINQDMVNLGQLLYLHSFHGDATETDGCASSRTYLAAQSDPPDFSGSGVFALDSSVPPGDLFYGSVLSSTFSTLTNGEAPFRLRMGVSFNAWVNFRLRGVQYEATLGADGCLSARIGGGIPVEESEPRLITVLTSEINYILATEPNGTRAQQLRATFDANGDNAISVDEVDAVVTFGADLDLVDADGNPGEDGVDDSLSVALAFGCVGAVYDAPDE